MQNFKYSTVSVCVIQILLVQFINLFYKYKECKLCYRLQGGGGLDRTERESQLSLEQLDTISAQLQNTKLARE